MKILNPLAQSFYVEHSNGMFVTSLDLYFYGKDENLPVTVQLRPMDLGQPSRRVYPFAEVVLPPYKVNTSEDGSIATKVTFPSPVYLTGNQFHSIVISSNSDSYLVWISEMGQVDSSTESDGANSRKIIIEKQPLNGGLFKSQNSSTWNEESYQDLKFTLYRADFIAPDGDINFYNPELSIGNNQVATLQSNAFEMNSKVVRLKLDKIVTDSGIKLGNTIIQNNSNAYGDYVGSAGSATGNLNIINSGIGYTPSSGSKTHTNVSLTTLTGSGRDATASITIQNGVAIAATIFSGGGGYVVGDTFTVDTLSGSKVGRNLKLSLVGIAGTNEIIVDNVQGDFNVGAGYSIKYVNSSNVITTLNQSTGGNVLVETDGITTVNDGLHIRVNHRNHGMHSPTDRVEITNASSDTKPTKLSTDYDRNATTEISVQSTTDFESFENQLVSSANPGYIKINGELIAYEGVTPSTLIGITRGIDQTNIEDHYIDDIVAKYELNGISLRRINKIHSLEDATVVDPIGLDYYNLKIITNQDGKTDPIPNGQIDRSIGTTYPKLYVKETKSAGGGYINATQNIQYSILRPTVQTMNVSGTSISPSVRTVSGRSIDGTEISFEDQGFETINLNSNNYFSTPRAIFSNVNESIGLNAVPGNKSLNLNLKLFSGDGYVSPVIDLDRVGIILSSNRVNERISNYSTDERVSTLEDDPSAFIYASNTIELEVPATSLKVLCTAYVNTSSDLRAFYAIQKNPYEDPIYFPFPGYNNIDNLGQTIDESLSDGTPDRRVPKVDILSYESPIDIFREYEFTENNIETFRYFTVKLVGTSTNQAYPPRIKDLRVIAVA